MHSLFFVVILVFFCPILGCILVLLQRVQGDVWVAVRGGGEEVGGRRNI